MTLQRQVIDLPFGGLDTKTAKQLVKPGSTLTLQDCEFDKLGAINKRSGFTALGTTSVAPDGTTSTISAGTSFIRHGDSLLMSDGGKLYRLSNTTAGQRWKSLGGSGATANQIGSYFPGAIEQPLYSLIPDIGSYQIGACDIALLGTTALICAYVNSGGTAFWSIVDTTSWSVISSGSVIAHQVPRCIATATRLILVWQVNNTDLYLKAWDPSSATLSQTPSSVHLAADVSGVYMDAGWSAACGAVVAYARTPGNITAIQGFDENGFTAKSTTIAVTPLSTAMSLVMCASGAVAMAVYTITTNSVDVYLRHSDLTAWNSGTLFATTVPRGPIIGYEYATDSVRFWVAKNDSGGTPINDHVISGTLTSSTITDERATYNLWNMVPASKPFAYRGAEVAWFRYSYSPDAATDTQPNYLLMRVDGQTGMGRLLGRARTGNAASTAASAVSLLACSVPPGTTYAILPATVLGANSSCIPSLVWIDASQPTRAAAIDGITTITGVQTYETDGVELCESGFHYGPELVSTGTGVGTLPAGTYYVVGIYKSIDNFGNVNRSITSNILTFTLAAPGSLTGNAWGYTNSARKSALYLYVSMDGLNYYYTTGLSFTDDVGKKAWAVSAFSTTTERLYTSGGVLEQSSPPCFTDVISRGRRMYGVTPEGLLVYTLEKVVGDCPAWSPDFCTKTLVDDSGRHWRLEDMDGRLFAIGENTLQWLSGDGLNNTGSSDDLSQPQLIPVAGGIVRYSPTLRTEEGIWMKQPQGLRLLTRSLSVETVGLPVDGYRSLTTVSAVNIQHKNQVRFGHSDGSALVYDLVAKQWSVFTNHTQVGAVYLGGSYYLLRSDGVVWRNDAAVWTDAGTAIGRVIELPWLHIGALQGVQRLVWLNVLGEYASAISLQLQLFYDYVQTGDTAVTYAKTSGSAGDPLAFRHHSGKRCAAVKPVLTDTSAGQGASLTGLSLEVGVRGQVTRLPQGQTV